MIKTSVTVAAIQETVLSHLVGVVSRTPVAHEPFTHVYMTGVFPENVYCRMLDQLPNLALYFPDNPKKYGKTAARLHSVTQSTNAGGVTAPISCRYTLPLNAVSLARMCPADRVVWSGVAAALTSSVLKERIFGLFADDLSRRFRTNHARLAEVTAFPRPTLVRDLAGYSIAPHPDTRAKIVTVQFYLARDASQHDLGTALYRRRLLNPRNLLSLHNMFEKVTQMQFLPNSGYAFPVGRHSWHGREEVPARSGERNSILLFYYRDSSREW